MKYVSGICFASLWALVHLAGCTTTDIIPERPFRGTEGAIQVGQTTRSEIRRLFGAPHDRDPEGAWEVYQAQTDGVRLVLIVPYSKMNMWIHYLFITYDTEGRVNAIDTGADRTYTEDRSPGQRLTLYAGQYGYHTGTATAFPSVDGGGKADSHWAAYLSNTEHDIVQHRFRGYADAMKSLCAAAKQGHPCAPRELGNLYWGGRAQPREFHDSGVPYCLSPTENWRRPSVEKDPKNACFWYSVARGSVLRPWCREILSAAEITRVERLLANWQASQCEQQLAPYICGVARCR